MESRYKFRGKSIHDGEWLYGLLNKGINGDEGKWYIAEHGLYSNVEVDPVTIGQYTGRKDSKKKEMYEGDIVKEVTPRIHGGEYIVIWKETGYIGQAEDGDEYGPYTKNLYINDRNPIWEIIGTIHDKKKVKKKKV